MLLFYIISCLFSLSISLMGPTTVYAIHDEGLRKRIVSKVKKYKTLNIPLVLSIVPSFIGGYDADNLTDILYGKESLEVTWDNSTHNIIDRRLLRQRDGLYTGDEPTSPILSSIMWIPKKIGQPLPMPNVIIFPNPKADTQLPDSIFRLVT